MLFKKLALTFSFCLLLIASQGQDSLFYGMGILPGFDSTYAGMEAKALLTTSSYRSAGSSASLKKYAPYPGNQGSYGTCTAWATAYAARTILEAQRYNWTDRRKITNNVFSPGFVYRMCEPNRMDCGGSRPGEAVEIMRDFGVPKHSDFPYNCSPQVTSVAKYKANAHKIKGFTRLWYDPNGYAFSDKDKIQTVKKSIHEGNPVIIAMKTPRSFQSAGPELWTPRAHESPSSTTQWQHGRHAMCVVGYDDNKYGGAFEVQNSWGRNWGNDGYVWIKYSDFAKFVYQTIELLQFEGEKPAPTPKPQPQIVSYGGELKIELEDGKELAASLSGSTYELNEPMYSGTRFRLYISNNEPAYVYAFGTDASEEVFSIFPYHPQVSAALSYSQNEVAIPSENHTIRLDGNVGTDYICVLYSRTKLDINQIQAAIKRQSGNFQTKLKSAVPNLINSSMVNFSKQDIKFSAKGSSNAVVALILKIDHK